MKVISSWTNKKKNMYIYIWRERASYDPNKKIEAEDASTDIPEQNKL